MALLAVRAILVLLLWGLGVSYAWANAAFSSVGSIPPTSTGTSSTVSITVPASGALGVCVGLSSTTATVTSVTWSQGGTVSLAASDRNGAAYVAIWTGVGLTGGAGTITVNLSAAVPRQIAASSYSGVAASVATSTSNSSQTSVTLTPAALTSADVTHGCGVLATSGNPTGVSPSQRYLENTTPVNLEMGDATGTTGVTFFWDTNAGPHIMGVVRLSGGAPDLTPPTTPTALTCSPVTSTSNTCSWGASTDAVTALPVYHLEQCLGTSCTFAEIGTTTSTTLADSSLTAGTLYSYRVRALDGAGNPSGYSSTVTATTLAVRQATVRWTDNATTEDGFLVRRCLVASGTCSPTVTLVQVTANTTTYVDTTSPQPIACYDLQATLASTTGSAFTSVVCTTAAATLLAPTNLVVIPLP